MSDDIVTRLRNWHTEHDSAFPRPIDLEAADEIKRLRAELVQANNQIKLPIAIETAGQVRGE